MGRALLVMTLAMALAVVSACDSGGDAGVDQPSPDPVIGGGNTGTVPGTDPGTDPAVDPGTDPGTDPTADPRTDPVRDPGTDPEPEVLPELSTGAPDTFTETSCNALDQTAAVLQATASVSDAGQVILLPSDTTAYSILLPASGVGYLTLEVPEWQCVIAQYSHHSTSVKILDAVDQTTEIMGLQWNASCQDLGITESRTKYHKWGAFTLEITGEPNAEVWLMAIRTE